MDLEVHTRVRVGELGQQVQRPGAGVQRDLGEVGLDEEDVVDVRLGGLQDERDGDVAGELFDGAERDAGGVEGEVVGGGELGCSTFDGGGVADVEVAASGLAILAIRKARVAATYGL